MELSDGHHEDVKSEPTRKSDRTISVANLLNKVERAKHPGQNLLEVSAKAAEQNNNSENSSFKRFTICTIYSQMGYKIKKGGSAHIQVTSALICPTADAEYAATAAHKRTSLR